MSEDLTRRLNALESGKPDPGATEGMAVHKMRPIKVSGQELKAAIRANPEHPVAKAWVHVLDSSDFTYHTVERADLRALLENKTSELKTTVEEFAGKRRKFTEKVLAEKTTTGEAASLDIETSATEEESEDDSA